MQLVRSYAGKFRTLTKSATLLFALCSREKEIFQTVKCWKTAFSSHSSLFTSLFPPSPSPHSSSLSLPTSSPSPHFSFTPHFHLSSSSLSHLLPPPPTHSLLLPSYLSRQVAVSLSLMCVSRTVTKFCRFQPKSSG